MGNPIAIAVLMLKMILAILRANLVSPRLYRPSH